MNKLTLTAAGRPDAAIVLDEIFGALVSYPLPAAEGERAKLAEWLRNLVMNPGLDYGAGATENLRRAAELLLTPAVGVSREEVERIVNASTVPVGGWIGAPSEVLACVRALPEAQPDSLSFGRFRAANLTRLPEFRDRQGRLSHAAGLSDNGWRPAEWLMALVGEIGEAANLLKKAERGDFSLDEARGQLADELADVATYLDLLAAKCGIDLGAAIVAKFDAVSERVGSSVRLAPPPPKGGA